MPFHEAISIAIASVKANKLRSVLTILGVVIGICLLYTSDAADE